MTAREPDSERYDEDEYAFTWEDEGIELVFSRFREERGELKASVQPFALNGEGNLPRGNVSVGLGKSMSLLAGQFEGWHKLIKRSEWEDFIKKGCERTETRYRNGEPAVVLAHVEWGAAGGYVQPPWVDAHGTTILFGDGGVSKSVHALAIAASVGTGYAIVGDAPLVIGPVVYLDWEADAETHAQRLAAICASAEIPVPENIHYMRRVASLAETVRELRSAVAAHQAVLVIVDSVGAATGGDPEKAEAIIRCMMGMRALGVPVLAIHHVTKDQKDKTKPFGSVYAPNLARRTVRIDREQEEGTNEINVRLTTMKANFGGLDPSRGHRVVFDNDPDGGLCEIRFEHARWGDLPSTSSSSGAKYAIAEALRDARDTNHVLSVLELEKITGHKPDTLRKTLRRNVDWFVQIGEGWAMLATGQDMESVPQDMSRTH